MFRSNRIYLKNINVNLKVVNSKKLMIESSEDCGGLSRQDSWKYMTVTKGNILHKSQKEKEEFESKIFEFTIYVPNLKEFVIENVKGNISFEGFSDVFYINCHTNSNVSISGIEMDMAHIKTENAYLNIDYLKINNITLEAVQSTINFSNSYFLNMRIACHNSKVLSNITNTFVVNMIHSTCINHSKIRLNVIKEITCYIDQTSNHVSSSPQVNIISKEYYCPNKKKYVKAKDFSPKEIIVSQNPVVDRAYYYLRKFEVNTADYSTFSFYANDFKPFFIIDAFIHEEPLMIQLVEHHIDKIELFSKRIKENIKNKNLVLESFQSIEQEISKIKKLNNCFDNKSIKDYAKKLEKDNRINRKQFLNDFKKNEKNMIKSVDYEPLLNILKEEYPTDTINKNNRELIFSLIRKVSRKEPVLNNHQKEKLLSLVDFFNIENKYLQNRVKF